MITFENYTDKNEIIQDCLEDLEPFIERVIEPEEINYRLYRYRNRYNYARIL